MKRLLLAMLSWMIATAAFGVQNRSAQVIYTYHDPLSEAVYRVADECYAPVFSVEAWGWKVQLNRDDVIITAEGKIVNVPIRTVGGKQAIPLGLALSKLGADLHWDDASNTLTAKSFVNAVKVQDGKLTINSSLPVKASIFAMTNPPRLVVDILGAKLLEDAVTLLDGTTRMKQFKPDVVRVVVETAEAAKLVQSAENATTELSISLDPKAPAVIAKGFDPPEGVNDDPSAKDSDTEESQEGNPAESKPAPGTTTPPNQLAGAPTDPQAPSDPNATPAAAAGQVHEAQILVDLESRTNLLVHIRNYGELNGPVQFRKPDPSTLDVILPGTQVKLPDGFRLQTDSILNTIAVRGTDVTVLRFQLKRPMGAQVTSDATEVRIELAKPEVGNGKLAGKIVCIDAGHGGKDGGAHVGSVWEKNLTLAIAKKTAAAFAAAGATVVMTRKSDVYIPLLERNNIADANLADFFIAIHINSNRVANSMSGTITFHHKNSENGKILAECIQDELAVVNKLPNLGVWSDGKIYQSGFSVLRNASQPAVLIELGFVNHAKDRARMQQVSFHDDVADAIVKGVQGFLGNG